MYLGVIVFGSDQEVVSLMKAVRRNNATGNFSWIGSDGWSARDMVSDTNEAEVEGCLSVQPQANPVNGFEEYFLNLNVENNKRNPWFTGTSYDKLIKYYGSFMIRKMKVVLKINLKTKNLFSLNTGIQNWFILHFLTPR